VIQPDGTVTDSHPSTNYAFGHDPIASFLDTSVDVAIGYSGTSPFSRTFYLIDTSTGDDASALSIPRVGQIRTIFPRLDTNGHVLMIAEYTGNDYGGFYFMAVDPATWTIVHVYFETYNASYEAWNLGELFIMRSSTTTVSVMTLVPGITTLPDDASLIIEMN
jgi:hypothetical protein